MSPTVDANVESTKTRLGRFMAMHYFRCYVERYAYYGGDCADYGRV